MSVAYDFNERKQVGAYGERYLDDFFSRWYAITPASPMQQRQGIDRIFTRRGGESTTVEYKTDMAAARTGNAFMELISVDCRFVVGWAYSSCADLLLYYVPGQTIYAIEFSQLRLQLPFWTRKYELRSVSNEGYRARGILVPLGDLGEVAKQAITLQKGRHA